MSVYNFFKNDIRILSKDLSYDKYCLFALWNTERIIDLYNLFVQKYGVGDFNEIKSLRNFLWSKFKNENVDDEMYKKFEQIESFIPPGEKYPGYTNAVVLNIIICLDTGFKCLTHHENESSICSLYVYDTIRQLILGKSPQTKFITPEINGRIESLNIIQDEIKTQTFILEKIKENDLNNSFIEMVYNHAAANKIIWENIPSLDV